MGTLLNSLYLEIVFWMAWIIIPLIMEIIPAFGGFFILIRKSIQMKKSKRAEGLKHITLIIPVYNSELTLRGCLESVFLSDYPNQLIDVILVNNKSADNGFEVYKDCQAEFIGLPMKWLNAEQGKSKALNMALFNSHGEYVLHIDSDGKLHRDAIKNMVERFESNPEIHCMTGAVLTDFELIEKTDGFLMRLVRRCEFMEYAQAFLAGRNFESETNSIYTLSGAFSAFRKSAILKTQLYNTATVSEDTHVTFQMRHLLNKNVHMCETAFFFVDPIENWNKLYTQRQRWQRGEIEVSHMFLQKKLNAFKGFALNHMIRLLMFDHTFAFPRMIWYFALVYLVLLNYPVSLVIGSIVILYFLYTFSMFMFFLNVVMYLSKNRDIRKYYTSKWYLLFALPIFNFFIFWVRFAGIINSIRGEGRWKTATLTEELQKIRTAVTSDFTLPARILKKLRRTTNNE